MFFLAPSGGEFVAWSFDEEEEEKNNSINSTSIFSSITNQLRMTSPDSPAKDNPHRFYTKLQPIFWVIAG